MEMGRRIGELENEVAVLRRVSACQRGIDELFQRLGGDHKEVSRRLSGCTETNHVWEGVHLVLKQAMLEDHVAARNPNLTDEALRTNVAREAALEDFRHRLLEVWALANPQNKSPRVP